MWLDAAGFKGHIAAVTEDEVEPADTDHEKEHQEPRVRWGVVASVLLHIPVVALIIFGLPKIQPKPAEDESVQVELVPPPEEKKPEEKKPEEKPKEEEKPQEQAKAEPPPPPPPAKRPPPPPKMSPTVFEFADKDTVPDQREAGSPQQAQAPKPPVSDVKQAEIPPTDPSKPDQPRTAELSSSTNPVPEDIDLPQVETAEANPEKNGPASTGSTEAKTDFETAKPLEESKAPGQTDVKAKEAVQLTKARTLFSGEITSDPAIKTAMRSLSRSDRIDQLCQTELRQQLIHSSTQYNPRWLPSFRLSAGNVLDAKDGAFKNGSEWYDVRFRCEVDSDATRVVSFAYDVGDAVPRSQWKSRRFPAD